MDSTSSGTVDYKLTLPMINRNHCDDTSSGNDKEKASLLPFKLGQVDVYEREFAYLRSLCNIDGTDFFNSLNSIDEDWKAKGGKSGASFYRTSDDKYIVKEITEGEYRSFVDKMAPTYFSYLKASMDTCLAKILRVYELISDRRKIHYMVVMENLLYGKDNNAVLYDLKGKLERNLDLTEPNHVRTEEEFIEDVKNEGIYLSEASKKSLQAAVNRDGNFLREFNIMDYSLLVGIDKNNHEMICGIIDYLVPYSAIKKVESFAKSTIMSLTCQKEDPTVIPPNAYMKRLSKFVENEFKCVE